MTRIEGRTTFARTPEDVFDFLADPRNEPSYNRLIVTARKVTPGPIGPGTRFVQQTRQWGRVSEVTIDLVDCHRPHALSWHITSAGMDVNGTQHIAAVNDGTQVHWTWNYVSRGPLRLLGPLVGLAGRRLEQSIWVNMKRTLEADLGPQSPAAWPRRGPSGLLRRERSDNRSGSDPR